MSKRWQPSRVAKLMLENCKVTFTFPRRMADDDDLTIRIEDQNGVVWVGRENISWHFCGEDLGKVRTRLANQEWEDMEKRVMVPVMPAPPDPIKLTVTSGK